MNDSFDARKEQPIRPEQELVPVESLWETTGDEPRGRKTQQKITSHPVPNAWLPALVLCSAAPVMFILQLTPIAWLLLLFGFFLSIKFQGRARREQRAELLRSTPNPKHPFNMIRVLMYQRSLRQPGLTRDLFLIAAGMLIVHAIDLSARLDTWSMFAFTVVLGAAVVFPYTVSRRVYQDHVVKFPWRAGGAWNIWQWLWLVVVLFAAWILLPWYFTASGAYHNWPAVTDMNLIVRLFVGVSAVGIWDELFFICVIFALLRRHMPDWQANLLQAIVFVSFLWELGYQSWGPLLTIPFALVQGVIYVKTKSLGYVVTVHLLFDAVVFLALIHAHNPGSLNAIFPFTSVFVR